MAAPGFSPGRRRGFRRARITRLASVPGPLRKKKRRKRIGTRSAALLTFLDARVKRGARSLDQGLIVVFRRLDTFAQFKPRKTGKLDRRANFAGGVFNHLGDLGFAVDHKNLLKQH